MQQGEHIEKDRTKKRRTRFDRHFKTYFRQFPGRLGRGVPFGYALDFRLHKKIQMVCCYSDTVRRAQCITEPCFRNHQQVRNRHCYKQKNRLTLAAYRCCCGKCGCGACVFKPSVACFRKNCSSGEQRYAGGTFRQTYAGGLAGR